MSRAGEQWLQFWQDTCNQSDDFFGGPQGSPRTDKVIAASIQWAERIMEKIDNLSAKR